MSFVYLKDYDKAFVSVKQVAVWMLNMSCSYKIHTFDSGNLKCICVKEHNKASTSVKPVVVCMLCIYWSYTI